MQEIATRRISAIRKRMMDLGLTASALAEELGVTRQRVYQIIDGNINADMQQRLCEVLACKSSKLFEKKPSPKTITVSKMVTVRAGYVRRKVRGS